MMQQLLLLFSTDTFLHITVVCLTHLFICLIVHLCSKNYPSSGEKSDIGQSIIDAFPILKNELTGGFVRFFDCLCFLSCYTIYFRD